MNNLNIVTVIQTRMRSSRLPGKVLMPILDEPMLIKMIERIKAARFADNIVIATSTNNEDDRIVDVCKAYNLECFRGHPTDLLDRHYLAGKNYNADAVVKIPSDCPLIDPKIIDKVLQFYIDNSSAYDYVSNLHPATYPDGNDVEIFSSDALESAWREAKRDLEREHTTPFIWERPERFRIGNVKWNNDTDYSTTHRFTIDYLEDYHFIKAVYEELYAKNRYFDLDDILKLLHDKPEIYHINSKYAGKYWYENHLDELNHIDEYKNKLNKI